MLRTRATSVAAVAVTAIAVTACGSATTHQLGLSASLDAHHVVTPGNRPWKPPAGVAHAHGAFSGTLGGSKGRQLSWRITYSGVGTSALRIVDVHYGQPGKFGALLFRLCGPCTSGQHGQKKISATAVQTLKAGGAWVTVITGKYPNGVIRGQIQYSR
jgi:CHRD domain